MLQLRSRELRDHHSVKAWVSKQTVIIYESKFLSCVFSRVKVTKFERELLSFETNEENLA